MFDKNRKVRVGRDMNINIERKVLYNSDENKPTRSKEDCQKILKEEDNRKIKVTFYYLILSAVLFAIIFFAVPLALPFLESTPNNQVFRKILVDIINSTSYLGLSIIVSFMSVLNPVYNLWKTNDIQKKQLEILKSINISVKEMEHLNKS